MGLFATDSQALRDYVTTLHQLSSKLVAAHNQLTSAYQDLAKHLKAYKNIVSAGRNISAAFLVLRGVGAEVLKIIAFEAVFFTYPYR